MTTPTYDPEITARLIAEARVDDGTMLAAFHEFGDSYLIRTKHGQYGTHAVVTALKRLRDIADQLEAARDEVIKQAERAYLAEAELARFRAELEAANTTRALAEAARDRLEDIAVELDRDPLARTGAGPFMALEIRRRTDGDSPRPSKYIASQSTEPLPSGTTITTLHPTEGWWARLSRFARRGAQ